MTLRKWFSRNAIRPFGLLFFLVVLLEFSFVWRLHLEKEIEVEESLLEFTRLMELSLEQKNRVLAESLLAVFRDSVQAESILLCENGRPVLSIPGARSTCIIDTNFLNRIYIKPLIGEADYKIILVRSRVHRFWNSLSLLLSSLIFIVLILLILRWVLKVFRKELLNPLQHSLVGGSELGITELEEVRLALLNRQDLLVINAKNQAMVDTSRQVAHDIRSPLGSLKVALSTFDEKGDTSIRLIEKAVERITGIISDLEKNRRPADVVTSDRVTAVEKILLSLIEEKRSEFSDRGCRFEYVGESATVSSAVVSVLPSDFSRVFSNLINNGVEAKDDDPARVVVRASINGDDICIEVEDNGRGIPENAKELVFTKGFSLDKTGGMGLGLFHAREKVLEWGGQISIVESSGCGSTVLVKLPLKK